MKKYFIILLALFTCSLASYSDKRNPNAVVDDYTKSLRVQAKQLKEQTKQIEELCASIENLKGIANLDSFARTYPEIKIVSKYNDELINKYAAAIDKYNACFESLDKFNAFLKTKQEQTKPKEEEKLPTKQKVPAETEAKHINVMDSLKGLTLNFDDLKFYKKWLKTTYKTLQGSNDSLDLLDVYRKILEMQSSLFSEFDKDSNDKYLNYDFDELKKQLLTPVQKEQFDIIAMNICDFEYIGKEYQTYKTITDTKKKTSLEKDLTRIPFYARLIAQKKLGSEGGAINKNKMKIDKSQGGYNISPVGGQSQAEGGSSSGAQSGEIENKDSKSGQPTDKKL